MRKPFATETIQHLQPLSQFRIENEDAKFAKLNTDDTQRKWMSCPFPAHEKKVFSLDAKGKKSLLAGHSYSLLPGRRSKKFKRIFELSCE